MPSRYYAALEAITNQAIEQLTLRNQSREQALAVSRQVIRHSANAIRAAHRGEFAEARQLIEQAGARLREADAIKGDNPEIYYAGFMADARKEFSEANVTLAVLSGDAVPTPEQLGVDAANYLNGLADMIGELRRYILDSLRRDDFSRCEEMLAVMDEAYSLLLTVDFPEAVTSGLRHSADQQRGTLERTRGDLTVTLRQRKLELQLAARAGE